LEVPDEAVIGINTRFDDQEIIREEHVTHRHSAELSAEKELFHVGVYKGMGGRQDQTAVVCQLPGMDAHELGLAVMLVSKLHQRRYHHVLDIGFSAEHTDKLFVGIGRQQHDDLAGAACPTYASNEYLYANPCTIVEGEEAVIMVVVRDVSCFIFVKGALPIDVFGNGRSKLNSIKEKWGKEDEDTNKRRKKKTKKKNRKRIYIYIEKYARVLTCHRTQTQTSGKERRGPRGEKTSGSSSSYIY
jgi:hypothetical protein